MEIKIGSITNGLLVKVQRPNWKSAQWLSIEETHCFKTPDELVDFLRELYMQEARDYQGYLDRMEEDYK